jgi:iron-sulfur cluster assembly accessory protein
MTQTETCKQIHKEMTIEEIFSSFPQKSQKLAQEMTSQGLHCVGCGAATWETLEMGMMGHGFSADDVDDLVERLNNILAQPIDESRITLTQRAADKYREILKEEGREQCALRFGDKPGGCSGFEYVLDYSEKAGPEDEVFVSEGLEIHVHKSAVARLMGSEIDYLSGLNGSGFKISNSKVKGSCGCGKSQSY